jgi:hypothetical protein
MARPWPAPRPGRVTDGTVVSPRAANALVAVSLILLLGVVSFTAPRWSLWLRRPLPAPDLSPSARARPRPSRAPRTPRSRPQDQRQAVLPRGRPPGLVIEDRDGLVLERPVAAAQGGGGGAGPRDPRSAWAPAFPPGTRVLEVFVTARGVAYVDLSKEAATATRPRLGRRAHHGLLVVNSLTSNFPAVKRVQIVIEDRPGPTLAGACGPDAPLGPDMTYLAAAALAPAASAVASARPSLVSVRASAKADRFTESVIREMTRLAHLHGAVNLSRASPTSRPRRGQGGRAAAVSSDINQYAITWGARSLREAIAAKFQSLYGVPVDPEREITSPAGPPRPSWPRCSPSWTPGTRPVVFEPFYENYGPDAILSGAVPRFVKLRRRTGRSTPTSWRAPFGPSARGPSSSTRRTTRRARSSPRGAGDNRRPVPPPRRGGPHRRDLRAHPLRRRRARPHRLAAGHGRSGRSPSTA